MTYKSLYRKYRPIRFEDVCGQDFIVKTLNNAIFKGKITDELIALIDDYNCSTIVTSL